MRRLREVLLTAGAVLGGGCLLIAVAALVLDLRFLVFRSGSMAPAIDTGALAVARSVPAAELKVGDVVAVRTATGSRVTHRITGIDRDGDRAVLSLRGDANEVADAATYPVARADRVWFSVPWLGYAGGYLAGPAGLFVLGLYAAYLVRVLLRRTTPRHRDGSPRGAGRPVPSTAAALALVVAGGSAATLAGRSVPTLAAWTDAAGTAGSAFSTATVPAPANFNCGLLGLLSVSFTWSPVAGATSYTLHYGNGGASTLEVTGTSATITAALAGGTAWVSANRDFGSTRWTSAASGTRSYTVAVVSLCS